MDVLDKLMKWISQNRYKTLAMVLTTVAATWLIGCQPAVVSPVTGQKVDWQTLESQVTGAQADMAAERARLDAAIVAYNARVEAFTEQAESAREELARQYELRENVINTLGEFAVGAVTGNINPVNAVGAVSLLALSLFGGGAFLDGRRKDQVILQRKEEISQLKATTATAS